MLRELHRRDRVLAWTGWLHAGLAVVALALMPFDERTIAGVSPWLKPFKFMASIAIYTWTVAWFVGYLGRARVASWGISLAMILETIPLWTQAVRGTTSHYNVGTPLDAALFGVMGVMILVNTLLLTALTIRFFTRAIDLPAPYLWGIRLGFLILVAGSIQGMTMINARAHTIGAPDGGPGLPMVNWSTEGGDLRIAHALGLHAFQVMPLAGYLIGRWRLRRPLTVLGVFALGYAALMLGAHLQATAGVPLLR